jgi:RNA polymerase sigma factor (sigma-70 family)
MSISSPLIEDVRVLDSLRRIVNSLSVAHDWSARDDLMQEALIHLWLAEEQSPGQSHSWYLQGCRFRLQHFLAAGRSVDSCKRRFNRVLLCEDEESTELFERLQQHSEQLDHVSVQDIIGTIAASLIPAEREVLECLAYGYSTVEIARKLRLSTPTVTKYRRRIARIAMRLGLLPHRRNGRQGNRPGLSQLRPCASELRPRQAPGT